MPEAQDERGLLVAWSDGKTAASGRLMEAVYAQLRRLRVGGLTGEEIATVLGVAPITVKRDWALARAWLFRELRGEAR